jgi:hypothetical protein
VLWAGGWTTTRDAGGRIVRSASALAAGDVVTTDFGDGRTTSVIDSVDPQPAAVPSDDPESEPNR